MIANIAYCGIPPLPGGAVWNLDGGLIAALLLLSVAHLASVRRLPRWRVLCGAAGWLALALALVSPLCNLSIALFSARVAQHMVIVLIAAPLVASAMPRLSGGAGQQWAATLSFAILLWMWHSPGPYDATFASTPVYWAMHTSMFAGAVWFWATILQSAASPLSTLFASFVTGMQMSLLGALLTFSRSAWFAAHAATTQPWLLSPLEDQQIGGLVMWVPAGAVLTTYAIVLLGLELTRMSEAAQVTARQRLRI